MSAHGDLFDELDAEPPPRARRARVVMLDDLPAGQAFHWGDVLDLLARLGINEETRAQMMIGGGETSEAFIVRKPTGRTRCV